MTLGQFSAFCRALPATTCVIQADGSQVWKVGGKVFAMGSDEFGKPTFTFRVSDAAYDILKDRPGLRPGPHLGSRDQKWIQYFRRRGLSQYGLRDYIWRSHDIVARNLPAKQRIELGLEGGEAPKRSSPRRWSVRRNAPAQ